MIEQAIETAALMLGSDKSRGYCLEMICADFLAGANLDQGDPQTLLFSMNRFFRLLPRPQKDTFLEGIRDKVSWRLTGCDSTRLHIRPFGNKCFGATLGAASLAARDPIWRSITDISGTIQAPTLKTI